MRVDNGVDAIELCDDLVVANADLRLGCKRGLLGGDHECVPEDRQPSSGYDVVAGDEGERNAPALKRRFEPRDFDTLSTLCVLRHAVSPMGHTPLLTKLWGTTPKAKRHASFPVADRTGWPYSITCTSSPDLDHSPLIGDQLLLPPKSNLRLLFPSSLT